MIKKDIIYFGGDCVLFCDGKCEKAWGINGRRKINLSDCDEDSEEYDGDNYEYYTDDEEGTAPKDPGTYEGGCGKPWRESDKLNKWCCRECERSKMISKREVDEDTDFEALLPDFSTRIKNIND